MPIRCAADAWPCRRTGEKLLQPAGPRLPGPPTPAPVASETTGAVGNPWGPGSTGLISVPGVWDREGETKPPSASWGETRTARSAGPPVAVTGVDPVPAGAATGPGPKRSRGAEGAGPGTSPAETRAGTGPRPRPASGAAGARGRGPGRAGGPPPRGGRRPGPTRAGPRGAGAVRRVRGHGQPMRLACGSPVRPDPHPADAEVRGRDAGVWPVHARRGAPVREGERQVPSRPAVLREARVPNLPAGLAGLAVLPRWLRPSAIGWMAFWPTCGHMSMDQEYTSRFTVLNPLRSSLSDSPLAVGAGLGEPGVPERVPRPVAGHARKPAVRQAQRGLPVRRAGHRPRPHRVHDAQHGAACGQSAPPAGPGSQGPPHAGGHGACRGRGGPEHEGRDGLRQGYGGGTRPEPEAAGRTAPQPAGARRARPGSEAGPQGRGADHGEPSAYIANMQPMRPRPQDPPTVADTIRVWPAGSRPTSATVGGDLDSGTGGAFRMGSVPGRGTGAAAPARGRARGDPATRGPDGVEVPSDRCDP